MPHQITERQAMRWVQQYISAFGGDPMKVTMWGESAGGMSVALHMVTNGGDTEGLFHAAWMQSGSPLPVGDITHGQQYYDFHVDQTGCGNFSDTLQCLRTVPYDSLMNAINQTPNFLGYLGSYSVADIPFVTADVDDEGTLFSFSSTNITNSSQFAEYVHTCWYPGAGPDAIRKLMEHYTDNITQGSPFDMGDSNALTSQFKRITAFQGDVLLQAPHHFFLKQRFDKQNTWSFRFQVAPLNHFLDPHQVAPQLGPQKPPLNIALNSANNATRRLKNQKPHMPPKAAKGGTGSVNATTTNALASVGPNTQQNNKNPLSQNEIEALPSTVTNYKTAEQFLAKNLLSLADEPFTLTHVISILLQITQMHDSTPLPVVAAICTTAFILKKHVVDEMASEIASEVTHQITDTLTPHISNHVVGAIAPQMAKLLTTSDQLTDTLTRTEEIRKALANDRDEMDDSLQISADRIENAVDGLHVSVEDCQNALKLISPSLDTTQECLNSLSSQLLSQPIPTHGDANKTEGNTNQRQTYSAIAAMHLPPMVDKAIGRAAIRTRKILLDPLPGGNLFPPGTQHADI
ncbi:Alpha/Beta hydrolase protein, partial [Suillus ampliporus]